jgi:hypothetical protein
MRLLSPGKISLTSAVIPRPPIIHNQSDEENDANSDDQEDNAKEAPEIFNPFSNSLSGSQN